MQNFPDRLEAAIAGSGKSKGSLAAHAGVALSTVSRWLAGTAPKSEAIPVIAGFLGVDAKWLLTGEGPRSPSMVAEQQQSPNNVDPEIDPLQQQAREKALARAQKARELGADGELEIAMAEIRVRLQQLPVSEGGRKRWLEQAHQVIDRYADWCQTNLPIE